MKRLRKLISNHNLIGGFTLIEMIVAVSIFTIVMLVVVGALLSLNDSSRKAQALRTVIDNLNFAVEDMNRKIRTGSNYLCYPPDADGAVVVATSLLPAPVGSQLNCSGVAGAAISLQTEDIDPVTHAAIWAAYVFEKDSTGVGSIKLRKSVTGGGPNIEGFNEESAITSPEVDIQRMEFRLIGNGNSQTQPMIIINMSGVVDLKQDKLRTNFSLQTAISKRGIE